MLYIFIADSFHTKKLCSRHSSSKVGFYSENGLFAFATSVPLLPAPSAAYRQRAMFILGSFESA